MVLTPHITSCTSDGLRVKVAQYAKNMRRVLAGETLIDCLPAALAENLRK